MDDWLPPLIMFDDYNGNWDAYLEVIYQSFLRDFFYSKPSFCNKKVGLKRHPIIYGKEATFWHFISKGREESDRYPDIRRCERIDWIKPIIEAYNPNRFQTSKIKTWEEYRKNERRIVISLHDFSYMVIIADRGDYVLPWTAYFNEFEHQRKKQEKKFIGFNKLMPPPM